MKRFAALVSLLVLCGCPKDAPKDAPGDAAAAAPKPTGDAAPATDGGKAADAKTGASTWAVTYTLTPGSMYAPEMKSFKNEETKYLGEGKLTLNVDENGKVTGTSEGDPLGSTLLDGQLEGETLNATVRRKDPADLGLVGTLTSTIKDGKLEGEMHLSESNAAVVRLGKISGTKAK